MSWQDIILVLIGVINGIIAANAVKIYNIQNKRIESLQKMNDELVNTKIGRLDDFIGPLSNYIDLLRRINEEKSLILNESSSIHEIKEIVHKNNQMLERLLNFRLTISEKFSKAVEYEDE